MNSCCDSGTRNRAQGPFLFYQESLCLLRALPLTILVPGFWLLDSAVCKTAPPTRRFFNSTGFRVTIIERAQRKGGS